MKKKTYSLYETKAHLSAIVRQVREGDSVIVTVHGEPAVEIRPVAKKTAKPLTPNEARRLELIALGELIPARDPHAAIVPGRPKPGALKRFLADRNK
ncbi:MAG: type II toxin-antitoxin system prevent-host-death family antitoxin [Gemmatimonadota bacterium]|nr:type II toxin-antitoxin system prevent-host-death family antitoxin [Gemmatimonadota bacterium]